MGEERISVEEQCMRDQERGMTGREKTDLYEELCKSQIPSAVTDDWSESRHY